MARLQNEVGTKDFCSRHEFSHEKCSEIFPIYLSRAAKRGGFKRGCFPIWTCPSFFVLFCPFPIFWDFPDLSGDSPGIFPIGPFPLGLLRAPTRNSPERVCDTIWTFPERSGKPPGLETPGLASPKFEPLFCVSEKIPQNSRQISRQISLAKIKKNHRRASAGGQGEQVAS